MLLSKKFRANYISKKLLEKYIDDGSKVIDIGAGDCILTETLKDVKSLDIIAVDKENYSETDITPIVYDGMKLPFDDEYFDCANIIFVLHYVKNREELLGEAVRVARKKIIIISDIYSGYLGGKWARIWGYLANTSRSYDHKSGFAISEKELDKIISDLELKIQDQKSFRMMSSCYLQKHKLVVLEKQ